MVVQQTNTSSTLKLYVVDAVDTQGDPLDTLIWAANPGDAVRDWFESWEIEEDAYDLADIKNPQSLTQNERQTIVDQGMAERFEIGPRYREIDPAEATAGVIDWPDWLPAQVTVE